MLLKASTSVVLAVALLLVLGVAPTFAASAAFDGISADGSVAVFSTKEQMVPGDTDQEEDVYVRAFDSTLGETVTREVSIGPSGGNDTLPAHYDGISADGNEVFFSTKEPLTPEDTDHGEDIYVRNLEDKKTTLVSQGDPSCAGSGCGNGETGANFVPNGVVPDGGKVFFTTSEALNAADKDGGFDIYQRDIGAGTTTLVSVADPSCTVGCGGAAQAALFLGTDEAGTKAFFETPERLAVGDADTESDIYQRDLVGETTSLISVAGTCPENLGAGQNCEPSYGGAAPDGSHVFFETNEQLTEADTDSSQDVYDWAGSGTPTLASIGPDGGNAKSIVTYAGTSADGKAVFFQTDERLDATADTDQAQDVYQRFEGATTLISAGETGKGNEAIPAKFEWASTEGASPVVVFSTTEQLTAADTDSSRDVYERAGGVTKLISTGPENGNGGFAANFVGASGDGSKVFFVTSERLVPQDTDSSADVYMRSGTSTVLVSSGQVNGNGPFSADLRGVSASGSKAFFTTEERLTEGDLDAETDVYSWGEPGTTLLVSARNGLPIGPPPPTLEATVPASPGTSTTPTIVGHGPEGALIKVYKTFDCSGEVVAQGTAEELASPGLTVTVPVAPGSTTGYRATAEVEGIVSACSSPIAYKQEEPAPPPPPAEEGSSGSGGGTGGGTSGGTGSSTSGGTGGTGGETSGGTVRGGFVYVTPIPQITFAPATKTRLRRPTFRFADATEQPFTDFFCKVDGKGWKGCSSPFRPAKLKPGSHVFSVKAVNAVGTPSASAVKRRFKVVGR
ncbi:MAG TPA: hypothetical protein VFS64_08550 [Solirubrobacterales bacterium]|nr:hypothetical protein [Solirubrobacterales bacterium]